MNLSQLILMEPTFGVRTISSYLRMLKLENGSQYIGYGVGPPLPESIRTFSMGRMKHTVLAWTFRLRQQVRSLAIPKSPRISSMLRAKMFRKQAFHLTLLNLAAGRIFTFKPMLLSSLHLLLLVPRLQRHHLLFPQLLKQRHLTPLAQLQ